MTDTEFQEHPALDLRYVRHVLAEQSQDIADLRQRVAQLELERHREGKQ